MRDALSARHSTGSPFAIHRLPLGHDTCDGRVGHQWLHLTIPSSGQTKTHPSCPRMGAPSPTPLLSNVAPWRTLRAQGPSLGPLPLCLTLASESPLSLRPAIFLSKLCASLSEQILCLLLSLFLHPEPSDFIAFSFYQPHGQCQFTTRHGTSDNNFCQPLAYHQRDRVTWPSPAFGPIPAIDAGAATDLERPPRHRSSQGEAWIDDLLISSATPRMNLDRETGTWWSPTA